MVSVNSAPPGVAASGKISRRQNKIGPHPPEGRGLLAQLFGERLTHWQPCNCSSSMSHTLTNRPTMNARCEPRPSCSTRSLFIQRFHRDSEMMRRRCPIRLRHILRFGDSGHSGIAHDGLVFVDN